MKGKISILLSLLVVLSFLTFSACSDDNKTGFVEYTNPMANNPVNSFDWLKQQKTKLINSMQSEKEYFDDVHDMLSFPLKSSIELYQLDGKDYYLVMWRTFIQDVDFLFLYDSAGERILSVGGEVGYPENEQQYEEFMTDATPKAVLWEYKYVK